MKPLKRLERTGKKFLRRIAGWLLRTESMNPASFDRNGIRRILLIRQDSRLGNLVLMSPMIDGLRSAFPDATIDVLISEGFESVLANNAAVDNAVVFHKKRARLQPWSYIGFIRNIRRDGYDLAIDVADGRHLSLNNMLLTALSGARYRLGYDREDASVMLNLAVPAVPADMHMADALQGLVRYIASETPDYPMSFHLANGDREFAGQWLVAHDISDLDSFFVLHPGGKGNKRWETAKFASLIDRITAEIGVGIVCIAGAADTGRLNEIRALAASPFEVLTGASVNHMAAVIEKTDLYISGDTGPMHVASALGRPTVGIFLSSDFRIYGPRGENTRIVLGENGDVSVDDVMLAIADLVV